MSDYIPPDMTIEPQDACDQPGTGWLAGFMLTCAIVTAFAFAYALGCMVVEAAR